MRPTNEQLEEMLLDLRDAFPGSLQQRELIAILASTGKAPNARLSSSDVIEGLHTLKIRGLVTSNISRLRARVETPFRAPLQNEDIKGPNLIMFTITPAGIAFLEEQGF